MNCGTFHFRLRVNARFIRTVCLYSFLPYFHAQTNNINNLLKYPKLIEFNLFVRNVFNDAASNELENFCKEEYVG
jgi:hypothetical protein